MSDERLARVRAAYLAGKLAARFDGTAPGRSQGQTAEEQRRTNGRAGDETQDEWHH